MDINKKYSTASGGPVSEASLGLNYVFIAHPTSFIQDKKEPC